MSVKMRGTRQREIENLLSEYKQNRKKKSKWTTYGVMVFFFLKEYLEDNILH